MKQIKLLGLLMMPVALGIFLASCGGSGGRRDIPNGRVNFQIGDFIVLSPSDGSDDVCLQPQIQIVVPRSSGLCSLNQGLEEYIRVRQVDDDQYAELLPTMSFRSTSADRDTCVVETRPVRALTAQADYYISIDKEGAGRFVFEQGNASRFTTTTVAGNQDCDNAFVVNDPGFKANPIFNVGRFDSEGDWLMDEEVLEEVFEELAVDLVQTGLFGYLFQPIVPQDMRINFNKKVDSFGLRSLIRVYEFEWNNENNAEEGFSLFQHRPLNLCTGNPSAGPNNECIYVNPNDERQVFVTFPGAGLPRGLYVMFIMDALESQSGQRLGDTYYRVLR